MSCVCHPEYHLLGIHQPGYGPNQEHEMSRENHTASTSDARKRREEAAKSGLFGVVRAEQKKAGERFEEPYKTGGASVLPPAAKVRARVITLCGSTRFKADFHAWNSRLTMEGNLVISVGFFGHGMHPYHQKKYLDPKKPMLDALHLQKIDLADEVFVIDPGGYIGDSTRNEVAYARATGKPIVFLSQIDPDCAECGLDNRNGTHFALERTGRLSHPFSPAPLPEDHPARAAKPTEPDPCGSCGDQPDAHGFLCCGPAKAGA